MVFACGNPGLQIRKMRNSYACGQNCDCVTVFSARLAYAIGRYMSSYIRPSVRPSVCLLMASGAFSATAELLVYFCVAIFYRTHC
jgi:hypothetical protein